MIKLELKTKRKGRLYLTFSVTPEGEALDHLGDLVFRTWKMTHKDGTEIQDPELFKSAVSEIIDGKLKVSFDVTDTVKKIEVGLVKEFHKWFETKEIDL